MARWIKSHELLRNELIVCFEHTGWYSLLLGYYLHENGYAYSCVNPMEIKCSMGLRRGKTDKTESKEIARYAWLRREEAVLSVPPPKILIELQRMMSLR